MTIPQPPPDREIPDAPPIDTPNEIPPEVPPQGPPGQEPDWRSPGEEEPPMRMPIDNPDVETDEEGGR